MIKRLRPRTETALEAIKDVKSREEMKNKFLGIMGKMAAKFKVYVDENKEALKWWRFLSILDPRNLANYKDVCIACSCLYFYAHSH
jgi:hypothetical protein